MRVPRIYIDVALTPITEGEVFQADSRVANYLRNALRLKEGSSVMIFDGKAGEYAAVISTISKRGVELSVEKKITTAIQESPLAITLAIGLSKGERMDWVMQKATELGVSVIQPLLTERVDVKLDAARLEKRQLHWRNTVIAACEQCGQNVLPQLNPPISLAQWFNQSDQSPVADQSSLKVALALGAKPLSNLIDSVSVKPSSAAVLIGPEGGLSEQEIDLAASHGYSPVSLGNRVLRTETAPVVIVSLLQYFWGDFG